MENSPTVLKPVDVPDVTDVTLCQDYAGAHLDGLLDPRDFTAHERRLVRWGLVLTYFRNNERN